MYYIDSYAEPSDLSMFPADLVSPRRLRRSPDQELRITENVNVHCYCGTGTIFANVMSERVYFLRFAT